MRSGKVDIKMLRKESSFRDQIVKIPDRKSCDRVRSLVNKIISREVSDYFSTETSAIAPQNKKSISRLALHNDKSLTDEVIFDQSSQKKPLVSFKNTQATNYKAHRPILQEEIEITGSFRKTIMTQVKKNKSAEITKEAKLKFIDRLFEMRTAKNIFGEKAFCDPSVVVKNLSFEEYKRRRYKVLKSSNLQFCHDRAVVEKNSALSKESQNRRNPKNEMPDIWFTMKEDQRNRRNAAVVKDNKSGERKGKLNGLDLKKLNALAKIVELKRKTVMSPNSSDTSPRSILEVQKTEFQLTTDHAAELAGEINNNISEEEQKNMTFLLTEAQYNENEQQSVDMVSGLDKIREFGEFNSSEQALNPNGKTQAANETQFIDALNLQKSENIEGNQSVDQNIPKEQIEPANASHLNHLQKEQEAFTDKNKDSQSNIVDVEKIGLYRNKPRKEGLKKQLSFLEYNDNPAKKTESKNPKAELRNSMELPPVRSRNVYQGPQLNTGSRSVNTSVRIIQTSERNSSPFTRHTTPTPAPNLKRECLLNNRMKYKMISEPSFEETANRLETTAFNSRILYNRANSFITNQTDLSPNSEIIQSFQNIRQKLKDLKNDAAANNYHGYLGPKSRNRSFDYRNNSKTKKAAAELMSLYHKFNQEEHKKEKDEDVFVHNTGSGLRKHTRLVIKARRQVLIKDLRSYRNRISRLWRQIQ